MRRFLCRILSILACCLWKIEIAVQAAALKALRRTSSGASLDGSFVEPEGQEVKTLEDVLRVASQDVAQPVLIDTNKIFSGYGFNLADHHPLVMEIRFPGFLDVFFSHYQPASIQEAWFPCFPSKEGGIAKSLILDRCIPWLPWLVSEGFLPTNDIGGSGYGHGSQFRGPISNINLQREKFRMHSLYEIISKEGYHPEVHGHISGQFIERNGEWLFVVLGGNHRSAVLSALGRTKIPVITTERAKGKPMVVTRAHMRNPSEDYVFDALFSRYGRNVRREFIEQCLYALRR
jgi:hypothetical protein